MSSGRVDGGRGSGTPGPENDPLARHGFSRRSVVKKVCPSLESLVKPSPPFRRGRNHQGGSASKKWIKIPERRIKEEHSCVKPADAARNKDVEGRGSPLPVFSPRSFARRIAFPRIRTARAGASATADAANHL